jgi:hypothetical protein
MVEREDGERAALGGAGGDAASCAEDVGHGGWLRREGDRVPDIRRACLPTLQQTLEAQGEAAPGFGLRVRRQNAIDIRCTT